MTSEIKTTTGVFGRITAWWHGLFETVPPELAQCEFECRERTCDAEKFDGCLDRVAFQAKIRGSEPKAVPCVAASPAGGGANDNKHNGGTFVGLAD